MPNVGISVSHRPDGERDPEAGTSLGLVGNAAWFFGSVVPATTDRPGESDLLHDFLIRLLALQLGGDLNVDIADAFATTRHPTLRLALSVHAGGFLGIAAGVTLRTAANDFAATATAHVGGYLCLGPFTVDVRVASDPLALVSSLRPYPEARVMLVVTLAPMPTLSVITDWKNPFNPEGG